MAISLLDMVAMYLRQVPAHKVRRAYNVLEREHLPASQDELEIQALVGCDLERLVEGLLEARRQGLEHRFRILARVQMGGRDPVEAAKIAGAAGTYDALFEGRDAERT